MTYAFIVEVSQRVATSRNSLSPALKNSSAKQTSSTFEKFERPLQAPTAALFILDCIVIFIIVWHYSRDDDVDIDIDFESLKTLKVWSSFQFSVLQFSLLGSQYYLQPHQIIHQSKCTRNASEASERRRPKLGSRTISVICN